MFGFNPAFSNDLSECKTGMFTLITLKQYELLPLNSFRDRHWASVSHDARVSYCLTTYVPEEQGDELISNSHGNNLKRKQRPKKIDLKPN